MKTDTILDLPESVLSKNQKRVYGPRRYREHGETLSITATVRYDDQCGNGHNSFSITGTISGPNGFWAGGCIHEEIAKHFPELAPFLKWHLFDASGPMHYIANTVYLAGDRDYRGLLKGEKQQIINGRTKEPCWELVAIDDAGNEIELHKLEKQVDGEKPTTAPRLEWRAWCHIGEGKARDFKAARSCAVWPEATDEQLSAPKEELERMLLDRLPALVAEFKAAVESLGFVY